jgi:hypothetical protein
MEDTTSKHWIQWDSRHEQIVHFHIFFYMKYGLVDIAMVGWFIFSTGNF